MSTDPNNRQIVDLEKIIEIQQEVVTSSYELDQLMHLICERTQTLTNAAAGVVEIAEGQDMVYRSVSGTAKSSLGVRLNINTSLSGLSVRTNEVLYCEDSEIDSRVDREACRRVGARSMICVPLIYQQKPVGVLKVYSPELKKFSDRDISVLKITAGLLSASISQARAREEKETAHKAMRDSENKAIEAARVKSEFLANMSHEIRTPLNGVMGMVNLLGESNLDNEQRKYLEMIRSSADALLTIVNDILDFSKIEAKKLTLEKIDFALKPAVEDIRQILSFAAAQKGLIFEANYDEKLPQFITGDPTRIRQIILNLAGNAIKFTKQGSVKINVKQISRIGQEARLEFQVVDTGIGIPKHAVQNLFQSFTQVDASTTRKFGGTGLGLSICRQLVEMMGGQIGVNSTEGQGSEFWFDLTFPVADPIKETQEHKVDVKAVAQTKWRILVAEDNTVNQMIVKSMLQKPGHIVTIVANGQEAIDALKIAPYDVVLMDCQMPEMDGFEATRTIRKSNELWNEIPIIAMTANAMAGDRERCLEAGMDDYISKPMRVEDLFSALQKKLG